ncbi:MAG: AraC family transcriptional regulator [Rhodobacter sp.]|nr:AraC family transcriptional regulator [Paracoccaceae bacterium]MCC0078248.1 AraC family transcriptional regulator [Rhodobacter sp.]
MRPDMERRILRVTDYIFDNPAGDLSLATLAGVAAMSPYHWHRMFHAMTGEPLAQAVRRIRLQRASQMLVHEDRPVAEIARLVGYPNTASFSRAFAARFGMAPLVFRQSGVAGPGNARFRPRLSLTRPFEIRDLPPLRLAALPHRGDYNRIDRAFETVLHLFAARGLLPQVRGVIGVFPDDPAAMPFKDLSSHAGFAVDEGLLIDPPLEDVRLPGGRHVVVTVTGPFSGLADAYDQLFNAWLPDSGEEPADSPAYIAYLTDAATTPPAELVNEIRLPLMPR